MLYGMSILPHIMKLTVIVIVDWLSVWCVAFYVDFGSVRIPRNLNVPPSLRMLGIEPQSKLNCEVWRTLKKSFRHAHYTYYQVLDENIGYEVRWAIAGKSIVTQLVARLSDEQYMAFGLSGDPDSSVSVLIKWGVIFNKWSSFYFRMVGGDVTVAWMDHK